MSFAESREGALMENEPAPSSAMEDIPTHPEEMKAVYNLRVGKSISLQGSARLTPPVLSLLE